MFFASGLVEVVLNPLLGRYSDRVGRLLPIRAALAASMVVALALAASSEAAIIALLVCAAGISFGSLYTPSMSLTSHRAETAGLAQGLAFGVMNTAWASASSSVRRPEARSPTLPAMRRRTSSARLCALSHSRRRTGSREG